MLVIVFRAAIAPLVTLLPAIWVLEMSGRIIAEASTAGLQVSTITQTMLTVLLLGAGTDYGLFLIMRARRRWRAARHRTRPSMRGPLRGRVDHLLRRYRHSRAAVPAAGLVRPVFGTRPALALGVAIMLVAALTLIPALLAVFGRLTFWLRPVRLAKREGVSARVADVVIAHPAITLIIGVLFLGRWVPPRPDTSPVDSAAPPPARRAASRPTAPTYQYHYPPAVEPDQRAAGRSVLGVEEPHAGPGRRERPRQEAGIRLGHRAAGCQRHRGQRPAAEQSYAQLGPPGKLPATEPAGTGVSAQQYAAYRVTCSLSARTARPCSSTPR